jgi:small GTP-binding protein
MFHIQRPIQTVFHQIINLNAMSLSEKPDIMLKVVFVGQPYAGKTSLLNRIADNCFHENYLATIGCDFKIRSYQVNGMRVKVQFWDTAGQERFRAISAAYYKSTPEGYIDADAVVLCYNLNDVTSFSNLNYWLDELVKYKVDRVNTILVGCKKDLEIEVPTDAVLEFLKDRALLHFETSAKTGEGVEEAMQAVVNECARRKISKLNESYEEPLLKPDMLKEPVRPARNFCFRC